MTRLPTIALGILVTGCGLLFSGAVPLGGMAGELVIVATALSLTVTICAFEALDA